MAETQSPREGEVYKILTVGGKQFKLLYGYYCEEERASCDPMPIYPDLAGRPEYTDEGLPIVTRIQDSCRYYQTVDGQEGEGWCADCIYYPDPKDEMGVCQNENNRISVDQVLEEA